MKSYTVQITGVDRWNSEGLIIDLMLNADMLQ